MLGAVFADCFIPTCGPSRPAVTPHLVCDTAGSPDLSLSGSGTLPGDLLFPRFWKLLTAGNMQNDTGLCSNQKPKSFFFGFFFPFLSFFFSFLKDLSLHLLHIYPSADLSQYPLREGGVRTGSGEGQRGREHLRQTPRGAPCRVQPHDPKIVTRTETKNQALASGASRPPQRQLLT